MHNDEQCFVGWGIHSEWNKDKKCGPQKKESLRVNVGRWVVEGP